MALKTTGLQLAIASTLGTQFTVSAVSNASQGVATLSASHGVVANDIIVLTSGWARLNSRVVRAESVSTNDVTLDDINTTSTTDYPAGEGIGTGQEITAWTNITGLRPDFTASGGGFEELDVTEISDIRRIVIPGLAQPIALTFNFHWPAASAWQSVVESAANSGTLTPYRISLGTKRIYGNAYWGFINEPSNTGGVLTGQIQLSTAANSTYYAS